MKRTFTFIIFIMLVWTPLLARDWYVRPKGGSYGTENGTSYANAWDGLESVVWGSGGVVAGDTLYICGLHLSVRTLTDTAVNPSAVPSGTAGNVVTIRGDYPGDAGIVWGGGTMAHEAWVDEGSNTWSITFESGHYNDWVFEDVTAESWTVLDKKTSLQDCKDNAGSFYAAAWGRDDTLYVHCSDNGNPSGRITLNRTGYRFVLQNKEYITFQNLIFYLTWTFIVDDHTMNHITFDGCTIRYSEMYAFWLHDFTTYVTVNNCTIRDAGNGIYAISNTNNAPSNCTFTNNTIYDIGIRTSQQNRDAHGIGIMGGHDHLISGNTIYNCGSGITLYAYTNQEYKNMTVCYNYIHDNHTFGGANNRGIEFNCNNDSLSDKSGNWAYGNIVSNCDVGYRIQLEDEVKIYNNLAHNCVIGFSSARTYGVYGPNVKARNNIGFNNETHVAFATGGSQAACDYDYNLWYPDGPTKFSKSGGYNFVGWQGIGQDLNSPPPADPHFNNFSGSYNNDTDFKLNSDSPAIDTGISVGITQDYEGTPIPQGFAPDIGAFEHQQSGNPLIASANASPSSGYIPLTVNFTGSVTGGTSPYSYSWNFGDGNTSTSQNPSHTYTTAADFTVTLTVTDDDNSQDTDTLIIHALNMTHGVTTPDSPTGPSAGSPGSPYTYDTGGSTCSLGHNVEYHLDWGDGTFSTWSSSTSASHLWSSTGTYTVKAQARCTVDTNIVSAWSSGFTVQITSSTIYDLSLFSLTGSPAPGQGGTTNPAPGSYTYINGNSAQITGLPNPDYRFSKWTGDIGVPLAYEEDVAVTMDQNRSITAYFYTKCGDVNGDLNITPSDSQLAFDIFLGRYDNPTEAEKENADVNCDGTPTDPNVTPADSQAIFEKYLGMNELPGDCSCKLRAASLEAPSTQTASSRIINLTINDFNLEAGEKVEIPVAVDNLRNLKSFGIDITFPSELFEFVEVRRTEVTEDFIQVDGHEVSEGLLRVGGYSINPINSTSSSPLVILVFEAKGRTGRTHDIAILNTHDDLKNAQTASGSDFHFKKRKLVKTSNSFSYFLKKNFISVDILYKNTQ